VREPDGLRRALAVVDLTRLERPDKASGGIRSAEQAAEYLALADEVMGPGWAVPGRFRLGASALVDDLLARLRTAA
jgi:deoxyribose-phosphate aldolase